MFIREAGLGGGSVKASSAQSTQNLIKSLNIENRNLKKINGNIQNNNYTGSYLSSIPASIGDITSIFGQNADNNNAFNAAEAQKNRDFQERMSSTSYQRMVKDLQKAGLNPILAVHSGGASTPSGSTAYADTSSNSAIASVINGAMNMMSAQSVANIYTSASLLQAQMNIENSKWMTEYNGGLKKYFENLIKDFVDGTGIFDKGTSTLGGLITKGFKDLKLKDFNIKLPH